MFQYTVHVPGTSLAPKTDSLVFRRGKKGFSLLSYLCLTSNILKMTSDTLSQLLQNEKIKCPKNSTRKTKITSLLQASTVEESVPEDIRKAILTKLDEEEANKRKKQSTTGNEGEDHDEELVPGLQVSLAVLVLVAIECYFSSTHTNSQNQQPIQGGRESLC